VEDNKKTMKISILFLNNFSNKKYVNF